ncbi:type I restriction enzyme HsdR N-terminal domain-containing protein [Moheibacter lacus]|uniref:Type I restriction enzyme HsdR N-terminal domain-containing protein n=1 Tax=Moheibacter lacus TaxID=2745851 RepID=A0A838ZKP0_9FLAO|nr:type I restriction enzyme HsdR N-terminal domain-containing protein [Moheibacter lacus]MBA5628240.1 type I restriction enzyme HsdR N-terminal domain-containing protein [Moheibacter lacus]
MNALKLPQLNFPENYQFRFKQEADLVYIFCTIRKKWLVLTPEEWVRQNVVQFLMEEKKYAKSAINTEVVVSLYGMKKRADVIVFKKEKPFIIIECKAPSIQISQETFDQIARYNLQLDADYLMVTNGLGHYYCQMDLENQKYHFLKDLPVKLD